MANSLGVVNNYPEVTYGFESVTETVPQATDDTIE